MLLPQNLFNHFPLIIFLLILQNLQFKYCAALILKCPLYQMHLQKIVGFRPPLDYLTDRNLIYAPPENNFKDRNRITRTGNTLQKGGLPLPERASPTSMLCWRICNEDLDCQAYVHLLDTDYCYGYSYFERNPQYLAIGGEELPLVADAEAIFYEKTCLKVPPSCKGRLWTLTRIPGTSLVFQTKKTIKTLVTRRECAEKCLFEMEFKCLSASFAPSYRNNRERFLSYTQKRPHITLGRCMLSDKDKMIQPDAFRAAPYDEEYIENQCFERAIENDNCAYELYANSSFVYAEARYLGITQKECQALCSHETKFYCQGVSFHYDEHEYARSECLLHSEDIISMGPRSLKLRENSIYMRRVKCLDVQVLCTRDEMSIKYTPKDWFNGKMYASMHSSDCIVRGNGTATTELRLTIGTELQENRCGVIRAYEMTKTYQRTFISALVVIQNNPNVQTQGDRLIKVGCIMSNATTAMMMKPTMDRLDMSAADSVEGAAEQVPNAIALESALEYADSLVPSEGAMHINGSYMPILPKITLQIVDSSHQKEAKDVHIGQNLELQIVAEYSPHQLSLEVPPLPDFRATTLVAKTQDNQNYVLLIDERGCPTDASVFPALTRLRTQTKSILRTRFHAFKFSGTSNVNFDVKIRYCAQHCPPTNCLQYGGGGGDAHFDGWHRRRRRRRQLSPSRTEQRNDERELPPPPELRKVQNPVYISTIVDVLDERDNLTASMATNSSQDGVASQPMLDYGTMPLNYNLRVHGPDQVNSNSFLYGERGVLLIAGIDDQLHLDNICLNQSLLIAIFIFWLIFQVALLFGCCVMLAKYRRLSKMEDERRRLHEEYLEARRVHWADQGGYTL